MILTSSNLKPSILDSTVSTLAQTTLASPLVFSDVSTFMSDLSARSAALTDVTASMRIGSLAALAPVAVQSAGTLMVNTALPVTNADTTAPKLTSITDNVADVLSTGTVTYTFKFSEAVRGFTADDVTLSAGTKGAFTAISASEYTLVVTPPPTGSGTLRVGVVKGSFADEAGNMNVLAGPVNVQQYLDKVAPSAPTIMGVLDDAGSVKGTVAHLGRTDDNALVVRVGLQGTGAVSGDRVYIRTSAQFGGALTLDANDIHAGFVDIRSSTLLAGTHNFMAWITDASGNSSKASSKYIVEVDNTAPKLTSVTDNVAGVLKGGNVVTYTFKFSEAVSGFTADDITISAGTKGTFTVVSDSHYTLDVSAPAVGSGAITMGVKKGSYTDTAGNANVDVYPSTTQAYADKTAPTLTSITSNEPDAAGGPVLLTFNFSEAVTGFTADDVQLSAGKKGSLVKVNDQKYTMFVTPPQGEGTLSVSVAQGSFTDLAKNVNQQANATHSQAYDVEEAWYHAGQEKIDLGDGAQLIKGIQADGKWYYMFDPDSNNLTGSFDLNDRALSTPAAIAARYLGGEAISLENSVFTTPNGVTLRVPTSGSTSSTWAGNSGDTAAHNAIYDDMAAIWDLRVDGGVANVSAIPTAWNNAGYLWTASSGTVANTLQAVDLSNGSSRSVATTNTSYAFMAFEVIDTTGPKVLSISSDAAGTPDTQEPILYTFNFSEPVVGFAAADIVVTGGLVVGVVNKVTDTQYTASIVPSSTDTELVVSVSSATAAFKDIAGNEQRVSGVTHTQGLDIQRTAAGMAGDSVIDLGTFGQLIAPIFVEDKWYYLLDKDKSGEIAIDRDRVTMDSLDRYTISGTEVDTITNVLSINGITLVVPHLNSIHSGYASNGANNSGTAADGMQTTSSYEGLLAIWDLNNGFTTTNNQSGIPASWDTAGFSASNASTGVWASTNSMARPMQMTFNFATGAASNDYDINYKFAVLQVL